MKRNILFICCIIFLVMGGNSHLYYEVNLEITKDDLKINSIDVIYSRSDLTNPYLEENVLNIKLMDNFGNIIHSEESSIINFILSDNFEEEISEITYLDEFDFTLYLPYNEDTSEIVISDSLGQKILEHEINFRKYNLEELRSIQEEQTKIIETPIKNNLFVYLLVAIFILILTSLLVYLLINASSKKENKENKDRKINYKT